MLLTRFCCASLAFATRITARSVLPQRALFTNTRRAASVCTWPAVQPRNIATSKLYRSLFASSVRGITSDSSDATTDGDGDGGGDDDAASHSTKADDTSAPDHSNRVLETSSHGVKQNHRWKYRRPYTPGDVCYRSTGVCRLHSEELNLLQISVTEAMLCFMCVNIGSKIVSRTHQVYIANYG